MLAAEVVAVEAEHQQPAAAVQVAAVPAEQMPSVSPEPQTQVEAAAAADLMELIIPAAAAARAL
jgi:hypothetical protein